jgi:hypothetical protein
MTVGVHISKTPLRNLHTCGERSSRDKIGTEWDQYWPHNCQSSLSNPGDLDSLCQCRLTFCPQAEVARYLSSTTLQVPKECGDRQVAMHETLNGIASFLSGPTQPVGPDPPPLYVKRQECQQQPVDEGLCF